jgi:hypothetical protein
MERMPCMLEESIPALAVSEAAIIRSVGLTQESVVERPL